MVTSRSTILSVADTTPVNIQHCVRFLLEKVVQKYEEYQPENAEVIYPSPYQNHATPERLVDICEFIIVSLYDSHPDETREALFKVTGWSGFFFCGVLFF